MGYFATDGNTYFSYVLWITTKEQRLSKADRLGTRTLKGYVCLLSYTGGFIYEYLQKQ